MRLPLIPREEKFYTLFLDDAKNVLAAARLLEQFFRNYDERERLASQLRDAEHTGDQISHDIGHKLEATFVTPFDREAQFRESEGKSLAELLDEFEALRADSLRTLADWKLTESPDATTAPPSFVSVHHTSSGASRATFHGAGGAIGGVSYTLACTSSMPLIDDEASSVPPPVVSNWIVATVGTVSS